MYNLYRKLFLKSNIIILIIISFFSFLINYYYSGLGTFPIDTFFHYDSAARILKNELPIRDYWVVSGLIIDAIQSIFFWIFGINWHAFVIHSSIFNFLLSLLVYSYFLNLGINKVTSLIFTLCFSTLAYTISGTPFVDHHAIFFLLISSLLLIKAIRSEKNIFWFFLILFYFLSFFTKQVPAAYVIFFHGLIILIYIFLENKYFLLKYIISSSAILILILIVFLQYLGIDFKNFYIQYLDYPRSIGSSRLTNVNISFNSFFNHYKFLVIPFILILILNIKKIKNNSIPKKTYYSFFIFFSLIVCSIFHQVLTKNQIYIYFFIPLLFGILEKEFKISNYKFKNFFSLLLIFVLIFITLKYHFRYNETRKFHELENSNLEIAVPAEKLDKNLKGLFWITPFFEGEPTEEIEIIKDGIFFLNNEKDEIMLFTHYLFLDSVTIKNMNYPNRSFTTDGASMPIKENKHFENYKQFLIRIIQDKNIKRVYYFKHEGLAESSLTDYLVSTCYKKRENEIFFIYELTCKVF